MKDLGEKENITIIKRSRGDRNKGIKEGKKGTRNDKENERE